MFAMTLTMAYSMVDSLWGVNILGEKGLSALTAGTAIVLIVNSLSMGRETVFPLKQNRPH